jgi:HEAT repeat protein
MSDTALRIAVAVFGLSFATWVVLSVVVVGGRAWYDRRERERSAALTAWKARRLVRRAGRRTRTDWGRWRRIAALNRLTLACHPAAPRLLRRALEDTNATVAAAATRALAEVGDEVATELLLDALREGRVSRSRVASQIERLFPIPGAHLLPLVHDPDPSVRFWGATLLAPYVGIGQASIVALTRDPDANVRAAAVETLGSRGGDGADKAVLALLVDPAWFVRVHAARSAGRLLGAAAAPAIARLLSDTRWWVRTAAKDAFRGMGQEAIPALVRVLSSDDEFARNGAAEVLQDIGLVDHLALEEPGSALLQQIFAAGGSRLRTAAEARTGTYRFAGEARAA